MSLLSPEWSWNWPSWLVELLSGLACCILALALLIPSYWLSRGQFAAPPAFAVGVVALGFGIVYEVRFDANGWSWLDVGQRSVGILAGTLLYVALT